MDCTHSKWNKWTEGKCEAGLITQQRSCKKCGWTEITQTEYGKPSQFKEYMKEVITEVLEERSKCKGELDEGN